MRAENVKFYLKRPSSELPTRIFAKTQIAKRTFKYYLPKSIHPLLWDYSAGRPIQDRDILKKWRKGDPSIDTIIQNIIFTMNLVQDNILRYVNLQEVGDGPIDTKLLREYLDEKLGRGQKTRIKDSVISYVDDFIKDIKSGRRLNPVNGNWYAKGTVKNYEGLKVQLILYEKERRKKLVFDHVNIEFYNDYVKYFQEKNYSANTIGRHIKQLKVIMRAAEEEGLHKNEDYKKKRFQVITSKVDSIYLNENEIKRLRDLDLSLRPHYEIARDIFLIGCYTALRYSDCSRIRPHHIKIDEGGSFFISILNQKTMKKTEIPAKPELIEILNKYDNRIPKTHEQKVNQYIKEIGRMAGIIEEIEVERSKGGRRFKEVLPKNQLIQTHTARRSAATNMFLSGIKPILIMKITGHSSEKDLLRYIRIGESKVIQLLSKHSFFSSTSHTQ